MVKACQFCRRRKIKCDAVKPTCATCRGSNRSCVYDGGPQKQRPSAALIKCLQDEKATLEEYLKQLKDADDGQRQTLLESLRIQGGRVLPSLGTAATCSTSPSTQGPWHLPNYQELQHSPRNQQQTRSPQNDRNSSSMVIDNGDQGDDAAPSSDDEECVDAALVSPRPPEDNQTDHATIFSSTSSIQIATPLQTMGDLVRNHNEEHHRTRQEIAHSQTLRYQLIANAAMERQREHRLRNLTTIRGVPANLALHLLDLHWSRQHHTFLLTYRPRFMRELVDGGSYCTDLLLYAVFACSSKFSGRLETRSDVSEPETAGQQFFTRCDDLLLRQGLLSESRIPTIIALLMLGSTFIGRGMTSKGWLYTGYALRMVYDLGLHTDTQDLHSHNVEEIEIRRRVFWGAFICEKLQSLYLGRPPTIGLRDARVSRDFLDTFEELEPWEAYQDPEGPFNANMKLVSSPPCTYSVSVFQQLCLLSKIMTRIIKKIYFVGATTERTLKELQPLDESLTTWYRNLPPHLVFEPWAKGSSDSSLTVAPNHIILLTTYYSLVILLHRPFISADGNRKDMNGNNGNTTSSNRPHWSWKRCTTAARNITRLTLSYRSIYPLHKSNYMLSYAVYVASTIHVLNTASLSTSSERNKHAEASLLLGTSLRCLDELAVPNSGVADTAQIIRKLMTTMDVAESPTPPEFQHSGPIETFDNVWQAFDNSPMNSDFAFLQPFQDLAMPGQDLLFGFMNESISLETLGGQ